MVSRGLGKAASYVLHEGNVLDAYNDWPTPATIVSDGAYGVRGFHGDTTGQYQRGTVSGTGIISPPDVHPYPPPKTHTSDKPERDSGGNFGRVARVHGLMEEFIASALDTPISGIEARHWIDFFKVFTDASDHEQVEANMRRLLAREDKNSDVARAEIIVQHIKAVHSALTGEPLPEAE
jgi:hypothetical protein